MLKRKPIRYPVLVASQLHPRERVTVATSAATILTGDEAVAQSGKDGYSSEVLDLAGRVRVLKYKGAEVALFFRRQTTEIEPFPGDPLPVGRLETPSDAWVRLDLLRPSAQQAAPQTTKDLRALQAQLKEAQLEIAVLQQELARAEQKLAESTVGVGRELVPIATTAEQLCRLPGPSLAKSLYGAIRRLATHCGVEVLTPSIGDAFDCERHQSVGPARSGTVTQVLAGGFAAEGRVQLRARVVLSGAIK